MCIRDSTSAGWQVILCDPIWHVSSRSGVVLVAQTAIRFFTLQAVSFVNNVTLSLIKTGDYNSTETVLVGSRVHFRLTVTLPVGTTDLLVELFTPHDRTVGTSLTLQNIAQVSQSLRTRARGKAIHTTQLDRRVVCRVGRCELATSSCSRPTTRRS